MKTLDAKKIAGYPYTDGGKLDVLGDEGIIPSGTKIIEENGTGIDVYNYAAVDVNVAQGVMVNESYDISEGKLNGATITLEGEVVAHIPDGVTTIGKKAFCNNEVIEKVLMPDSVTAIEDGEPWNGSGAFLSCEKIKTIEFSNALNKIGDFSFYQCSNLTNVVIPDSVTAIGTSAFQRCEALTSITIPDGVLTIKQETFDNCINLTSVTIPDSVTMIGTKAFQYCGNLTSIVIPDSVTSVGGNAFFGTDDLTDIYYTGTQAEWEAIAGISDAGIPEGATIHYEYTPE